MDSIRNKKIDQSPIRFSNALILHAAKSGVIANLSANELRVWLVLLGHLNVKSGRCDPSVATIACEAGRSTRQISSGISGLIGKGVIRRLREGGGNRCASYELLSDFESVMKNLSGVKNPSPVKKASSTHEEICGEPMKKSSPEHRKSTKKQNKESRLSDRILFDLSAGHFVGINDADRRRWSEANPGVDVDLEIRRAAAWLIENPSKRKKNNARFIGGWLRRAGQGTHGGNHERNSTHKLAASTGKYSHLPGSQVR